MLALICILLSSCNNELEEKQIAIPDEGQTIVAQSGGVLSFDNEAAFGEAVEKVRNNETSVALLTRSKSPITNGDGFLESLSGLLKKAVVTYGFKYGSQYITDYWNNL